MRRDPRRLGDRADQADRGQPLPLRATAIVLSVWVVGLILVAFIALPLLFSTCVPPPAP